MTKQKPKRCEADPFYSSIYGVQASSCGNASGRGQEEKLLLANWKLPILPNCTTQQSKMRVSIFSV